MSRWCMGLPFTEIRPITSDEVDRYTAELRRHQRRIKRQGWLLGLSAAVAALVSLEYVNQERGVPGNDVSFLFFSAIAIAEKNNNETSWPGTPRSWFTYSRLTRAATAADNPSSHPCRLILL